MLVLFYKPFGVLSQFSQEAGHRSLSGFGLPKGVYPCGRLDHDSEGLLLLTDDGRLQNRLSDPRFKEEKVYWAQVDRLVGDEAVKALIRGVSLKDGPARAVRARKLDAPVLNGAPLGERRPPIRFRKNVPTSWLEIVLDEGRNRQVRRMTAAVGHPTLRLLRVRVGKWTLEGLGEGRWREVSAPRL